MYKETFAHKLSLNVHFRELKLRACTLQAKSILYVYMLKSICLGKWFEIKS